MDLVCDIYDLIKQLPSEEKFALADQLKRAVVSIPSNIAEGHSRSSKKEFHQFLSVAMGSRSEVETQLLICERVGYLSESKITPILMKLDEIARMGYSLMQHLDNV